MQHLVHRQGARLGQPVLHGAFQVGQGMQLLGLRMRPGVVDHALGLQAQLHLAALEGGGDQVTEGRLQRAKLVRHLEAQVQETAVDGPQFGPDAALGSMA